MSDPLSPERFAEIRADIALAAKGPLIGVPAGAQRYEAWVRVGDRHGAALLAEVERLTQQRDAFLIQRDNLRNMVLAECDRMSAEAQGYSEGAARIRVAVDAWHEYTAMTARMVQPDVTL